MGHCGDTGDQPKGADGPIQGTFGEVAFPRTDMALDALAHAWFTSGGIPVCRLITDNGSCYSSRLGRDTLRAAGITVKEHRPFRPMGQRRGRRVHRTLDEGAHAKAYSSRTAHRAALPAGSMPPTITPDTPTAAHRKLSGRNAIGGGAVGGCP